MHPIDVHILTMPDSNREWLSRCIKSLDGEPVNLHILPGVKGDIAAGRMAGFAIHAPSPGPASILHRRLPQAGMAHGPGTRDHRPCRVSWRHVPPPEASRLHVAAAQRQCIQQAMNTSPGGNDSERVICVAREAILQELRRRWKEDRGYGVKAPRDIGRFFQPQTNYFCGSGEMTCPICHVGKLQYARSEYNGHVRARCSTECCVCWME